MEQMRRDATSQISVTVDSAEAFIITQFSHLMPVRFPSPQGNNSDCKDLFSKTIPTVTVSDLIR